MTNAIPIAISPALACRWIGRLLSLASIGLLALFAADTPAVPTPGEAALLLFFPLGLVAGLLLAWRREGPGAALALLSLTGFYLIHWALRGSFPGGPWFAIFATPAAFFLASSASRGSGPLVRGTSTATDRRDHR